MLTICSLLTSEHDIFIYQRSHMLDVRLMSYYKAITSRIKYTSTNVYTRGSIQFEILGIVAFPPMAVYTFPTDAE